MLNVREFRYPQSLAQALGDLEDLGGRAMIVAGGTKTTTWKDATVDVLVDISRIGLEFVTSAAEGLVVGATTRLQGLADDRHASVFASGILAHTARCAASRLIRNASTVGGQVIVRNPHAPVTLALLALEARATVAHPGGGTDAVDLEAFLADARYRRLGRSGILTSVTVPRRWKDAGAAHESLVRTTTEPPWSQALAAMTVKSGKIDRVSVAVGSVVSRPTLLPEASRMLAGKALDETRAADVAARLVDPLDTLWDFRASEDYRRHVTKVLLRRVLLGAWRSATTPAPTSPRKGR